MEHICLEILNFLADVNLSFFVKYKDHISSIGVIVAIFFSSLALLSNPKEPDLVVSSEKIQNKTRVVIYNGGDGPCAGFKIKYPNHFDSVEVIFDCLNCKEQKRGYKNKKSLVDITTNQPHDQSGVTHPWL